MIYQIKIEQFEGPLDLLLQLIEQQELDITQVSLAGVTEQYLGYLNSATDIPTEELADFLVVAAISTIRIDALAEGLAPFLLICAAAIAWNVFCILVLARRMLPDAWFERGIAELGQSMGITATGLLLLRVVDPEYESPAADAFASKQLLHEPFMGGGLWTSTAIPLLFLYGGWPVFLISCGAVAASLAIVFLPRLLRRAKTE